MTHSASTSGALAAPASTVSGHDPWTARRAAGALVIAAVLALAGAPAGAEIFVDLGAQSSRVEARIANVDQPTETTDSNLHLGVGASRMVGDRNEFGVRLELDNIDSNLMLAVRALDYQRHLSERFAFSVFLGGARLDLATPAYGYYFGGGVRFKDVPRGWDLNFDFRIGDKIARDNVLVTDPQGGRVDNFYDVTGVSVYLSRGF